MKEGEGPKSNKLQTKTPSQQTLTFQSLTFSTDNLFPSTSTSSSFSSYLESDDDLERSKKTQEDEDLLSSSTSSTSTSTLVSAEEDDYGSSSSSGGEFKAVRITKQRFNHLKSKFFFLVFFFRRFLELSTVFLLIFFQTVRSSSLNGTTELSLGSLRNPSLTTKEAKRNVTEFSSATKKKKKDYRNEKEGGKKSNERKTNERKNGGRRRRRR